MTLLFTMGECIRVYELHSFAKEYTDMAVDSGFSEYNPYLWTNYKILAVDLGYGSEMAGPTLMEQKITDYCEYNADVENGLNYARLKPEYTSIEKYGLLTDCSGSGVVIQGIKASKQNLPTQIIDGIKGQIDSINNIEKIPVEEKAKSGKDALENAKEELAEKKRAADEDDDPNTNPEDYKEPDEVEDNPLDAFDILKESFSKGVLSTVTNAEKISDVSVELEKLPSTRQLVKGNLDYEADNTMIDKILFIDYLMSNYSYFGNDLKHDGLNYEVEYLLSGKASDTQSLASVVEQILLIRECANYTTILHSHAMEAQATAMAEALAGFTMNPVIVDAVKYAVIGAWAYAESTLDLRLLLSGGKVPAIKSQDQWTSDIWHLSSVANVNFKARDFEKGISYKEYLMSLLALRSNEKLAMRAIDIMENALASTEDYNVLKADNMLWAADVEITYGAKEMFLSLFSGNASLENKGEYHITKNKYISY